MRLDEYIQPMLAQGYRQVRDVTQLPWEDMEDIGIVKLGHQKKLLLAIKRVKDIVNGKWIAPGLANSPQVQNLYITLPSHSTTTGQQINFIEFIFHNYRCSTGSISNSISSKCIY